MFDRTYVIELAKCLSFSLGVSLAAAWLMKLLRHRLRHGMEEGTQSLVGNFVSFVATLFAFVLAFVIASLWGVYNEAEKVVRQEANGLRTICRVSAQLHSGERLQGLVRDYVHTVAVDEWPAMMRGEYSSKAEQLKDSVWNEALGLIECDKNNPVLTKGVLDSLVEMNSARRERLGMLDSSIHPLLWVGLGITGSSTLVGFFFLGVKQKRAQFILDFLVLLCFTLNMYLMMALDEPFSGTGFTLSKKPFTTLEEQLTTELSASSVKSLAPASATR
jgi:hypothetical protein